MTLPWSFSVFDYPELCRLLWEQCGDTEFETAKVVGLASERPAARHPARPRATSSRSRPTAGSSRRRSSSTASAGAGCSAPSGYQPPDGPLSRGLEVHPGGANDRMELWIERDIVPAGYGWSFPAGDELRVGVGSFDPGLPRQGADRRARRAARSAARRLPGQLDPPPPARGDRGRHLLLRRLRRPLPAADRRGDPHRLLLLDRRRPRAARRRRRPPRPRHGARQLRRLQRLAPLALRVDAAGPEARPAGAAAGTGAGAARAEHRRLRALVLQPLPRHRPALVRAGGRRRRRAAAARSQPEQVGAATGRTRAARRRPYPEEART